MIKLLALIACFNGPAIEIPVSPDYRESAVLSDGRMAFSNETGVYVTTHDGAVICQLDGDGFLFPYEGMLLNPQTRQSRSLRIYEGCYLKGEIENAYFYSANNLSGKLVIVKGFGPPEDVSPGNHWLNPLGTEPGAPIRLTSNLLFENGNFRAADGGPDVRIFGTRDGRRFVFKGLFLAEWNNGYVAISEVNPKLWLFEKSQTIAWWPWESQSGGVALALPGYVVPTKLEPRGIYPSEREFAQKVIRWKSSFSRFQGLHIVNDRLYVAYTIPNGDPVVPDLAVMRIGVNGSWLSDPLIIPGGVSIGFRRGTFLAAQLNHTLEGGLIASQSPTLITVNLEDL